MILYNEKESKYLGLKNPVFLNEKNINLNNFELVSDEEQAFSFSSRRLAQYVANKWAWHKGLIFELIGETNKIMFLCRWIDGKEVFIRKNEQSGQYEITDNQRHVLMFDDVVEVWETAYECAYLGLGSFYVSSLY